MDFPYIAFLWNPHNSVLTQEVDLLLKRFLASTWTQQINRHGLIVHSRAPATRGANAHLLRQDAGVIFGTIFDRHSNRPVTAEQFTGENVRVATPDQFVSDLSRNYWGGFVALFSDSHSGQWCVHRECSGSIPCYYTSVRGITIVTSDVRHLYSQKNWSADGGPPAPIQVNWRYLSQFLLNPQLQIRDTALVAVHELLAGETLSSGKREPSAASTWNPASFIEPSQTISVGAYSEHLRETTRSCIHAWASTHKWVVHSLSGGFDSSLVLALVAACEPRPHIVCINRYAVGPAEDERTYARLACQTSSVPLIEWPWDFESYVIDETSLRSPLGAKPFLQSLLYPIESRYLAALQSAQDFDAIWTGEGGDHLFIAYPTEFPVTDFLESHGISRRLFSLARDTSRMTGTCIPALLSSGLAHLMRRKTRWILRQESLRNARSRGDISAEHPWLTEAQRFPPGKQQQVQLLAEVLHRHYPISGSLDSVAHHPLLSQPLIELALRIPTYEMLSGGRARGLARRAFAADVPQVLLDRETKGETTHGIAGILHRSAPFIAKFLSGGTLQSQNLLDRSVLAAMRDPQTTLLGDVLFPLCGALAAETWARVWSSGHIV